jgi:hypothetical protein
VLLALPSRYRYEINFARAAMPGQSRDALQPCSLGVRPSIVSGGPQACLQGLVYHRLMAADGHVQV